MTGGEIFLVCFVIFIIAVVINDFRKGKLIRDMADKGYEEEVVDCLDVDGDKATTTVWKKS